MLRVRYSDHLLLSVHWSVFYPSSLSHFCVNTPASTNDNPGIYKIAIFDIVYTLASTNKKQSAPNLVKEYIIIRFGMSLIMSLIGTERFELPTLELEKIVCLTCLLSSPYK